KRSGLTWGAAEGRNPAPERPANFVRGTRSPAAEEAERRVATKQIAPVAQWIEQRFPKPLAGRPRRLGGARRFPGLRDLLQVLRRQGRALPLPALALRRSRDRAFGAVFAARARSARRRARAGGCRGTRSPSVERS